MRIVTTGNDHPEFLNLCCELDVYLDQIVGGRSKRTAYVSLNSIKDVSVVFLLCDENLTLGCAALKPLDITTAEIKRVFIREKYRGHDLARGLMLTLEIHARNLGFSQLVLETGRLLVAATNLYFSLGYKTIANYGPYVNMPQSVCMGKQL